MMNAEYEKAGLIFCFIFGAVLTTSSVFYVFMVLFVR